MIVHRLIIISLLLLCACVVPIQREIVYKLPDTYIHYVPDLIGRDGSCVVHGNNYRVTEAHVYIRGVWVKDKLWVESQEIFGHEVLHILQHAHGTRNPDGE